MLVRMQIRPFRRARPKRPFFGRASKNRRKPNFLAIFCFSLFFARKSQNCPGLGKPAFITHLLGLSLSSVWLKLCSGHHSQIKSTFPWWKSQNSNAPGEFTTIRASSLPVHSEWHVRFQRSSNLNQSHVRHSCETSNNLVKTLASIWIDTGCCIVRPSRQRLNLGSWQLKPKSKPCCPDQNPETAWCPGKLFAISWSPDPLCQYRQGGRFQDNPNPYAKQ